MNRGFSFSAKRGCVQQFWISLAPASCVRGWRHGAPAHTGADNHRAIGGIASGYAALEQGKYDDASRSFAEVLDPKETPKFFLHWYWRMHAELGLGNVWLASGNLRKARVDADRFLQSALSTAEPNLHALAWEVGARVAMAEKDWKGAEEKIEKGLAVLHKFEIPTTAWRVHATRSDLYRTGKE